MRIRRSIPAKAAVGRHVFLSRFQLLATALVLLWLVLPRSVFANPIPPNHLPTLSSVTAIRRLSRAEAMRRYPIDLKAVVTYFDPYNDSHGRPIIMVTDATGSIYVAIEGLSTAFLDPATQVEITGVSDPGDYAPIIAKASIHILGPSTLPGSAPRESATQLLTGSKDAQWVEVEGIVKSVESSGRNVTLKLALADGTFAAMAVAEPGADYAHLVDAKVLIRGIAGTLFNRQGQIFGVRLFFPGLSTVQIEEAAPANPFQMPVSPIRTLMQYDPGRVFIHRIHIRGRVTLFWPGRLLCIQDGNAVQNNSEALCAETVQQSPLVPGDVVDVIGFPQIGAVTPTLSDSVYQSLSENRALAAASIDANQAFSGAHDSQLVQIEGRIVAYDQAAQDPTIVVSSGKYTFPVILPKSANDDALLALQNGSILKITGICSVQADSKVFTRHDGYPVSQYFRILLRSSNDVVVLQKPSWWTANHTLRVLTFALVITLVIVCWTGFLSVKLKKQGALLHYQATHDGLTGIWNRKAVLDLLRREFEIAARSNKNIGVMMLDADHFKRINDTYGHLAGDAVLKELANRIQDAVRSYDLTGRYGGEEFLVVLPGCSGEELEYCAERVRSSIADNPIWVEGALLVVTVSVGTAVLDPLRNSQKDALAAADAALYEAKHSGRNCVVFSDLQSKATLVHAV